MDGQDPGLRSPSSTSARSTPSASVIIPAHNEAAVIGRTLTALLADARPGEFEIVVACNGCTDGTAAIAAKFPGVKVVSSDVAAKYVALNLGDATASAFPRVYLDADIELTTASARAVTGALAAGALAAAPRLVVDVAGCNALARAYFTFWQQLGYAREGLIGSGVYAMSAAGRSRFGAFPPIIGDDTFVYGHFTREERYNTTDASFTMRAPRTIRATVHRRIRINQGLHQHAKLTGRRLDVPAPNWRQLLRINPTLLPMAAVYLAVNACAEVSARWHRVRGGEVSWNRDTTTR